MDGPVAVLQHGETTSLGWLGDILEASGVEHRVVRFDTGEPVPDRFAALVSLGGRMASYEDDRYPFLRDEKLLLRKTVEAGVPVLGICLGCQLLADALGGRVFRGPRQELGYVPLRLTAAGRADPVVRSLRDPILSFHGDTWEPPPDAQLLAESDEYPQAFRLGTALGFQFHAEASPALVARWVQDAEERLRSRGLDAADLVAESHRLEREARSRADELFGAWLDEVRRARGGGTTSR